jgi:hypothetical protein
MLRVLSLGLFAATSIAASASARAPQYRVIDRIVAGDGGWDLLSVASNDR